MEDYNTDNEFAHLYQRPWSKANSKLNILYSDLKNSLNSQNFFDSHPNYELPYLLTCSRNYENAVHRIMVIAQETMGWGGEFSHQNGYTQINPHNFEVLEYERILHRLSYPKDIVEALMILYDERVNKEWGMGGYLWNFYESLRVQLEQTSPYKCGLIHNNLAKIANIGGTKINGVRSDFGLNKSLISLVKEEINLLDPDVIIFCTGNGKHYKDLIKHLSPEVATLAESLSSTKRWTSIKDILISNRRRKTMLSYHPRYLNSVSGGMDYVTGEIINLIKNAISL